MFFGRVVNPQVKLTFSRSESGPPSFWSVISPFGPAKRHLPSSKRLAQDMCCHPMSPQQQQCFDEMEGRVEAKLSKLRETLAAAEEAGLTEFLGRGRMYHYTAAGMSWSVFRFLLLERLVCISVFPKSWDPIFGIPVLGYLRPAMRSSCLSRSLCGPGPAVCRIPLCFGATLALAASPQKRAATRPTARMDIRGRAPGPTLWGAATPSTLGRRSSFCSFSFPS